MITNRDIELAFVRAQNRINENLERAQMEFLMPDMDTFTDVMLKQLKGKKPDKAKSNPLANEEI